MRSGPGGLGSALTDPFCLDDLFPFELPWTSDKLVADNLRWDSVERCFVFSAEDTRYYYNRKGYYIKCLQVSLEYVMGVKKN